MIGVAGTILCEHGKRYCRDCGSVREEVEYSPEQWKRALTIMDEWETKKAKKEKVPE